MRNKTCKSLLGTVVRGIGHEGKNSWFGVVWADIPHGDKSLHIAFGDIGAVMFEGLKVV